MKNLKKSIYILTILCTFLKSFGQTTFYVSSSGLDTNLGTELSPLQTISHAIDEAAENDIIHIIGVITENNIFISKSLTIEGDSADTSIVQAQVLNPMDDPSANGLNDAVRVFELRNASSTVKIIDLTVQHGYLSLGQGAGLYGQQAAVLEIDRCNFINNLCINQGGGVSHKGSLSITNSTFINNNGSQGGGVFSTGNSILNVSNSLFYNNDGTAQGGAIRASSSAVTLNNNTIAYNTSANNKGFGVQYNLTGELTLTNNIFFNNLGGNDLRSEGEDLAGTGATSITSKNNIFSYVQTDKFYNDALATTSASNNYVKKAEVTSNTVKFTGIEVDSETGLYALPLAMGSIAIGNADVATATASDMYGVDRAGDPDIGASEFVSGGGPYTQTISIVPIADKYQGAPSFDIQATTTSDLPLVYQITGPANIDGNTITLSGATGTLVVTVSQAGNDDYLAATETEQFEVLPPNIIYVSDAGNNDSGDGSVANPLATLSYAVTQATAGETIHLSGTFTESNITLNKDLTIIGDGAGSAVIQAQVNNPNDEEPRNPQLNQRVFIISGNPAPNIVLKNLAIRHGNLSGAQGAGIYSTVAASLSIVNCNIMDNYTDKQGGGISHKGALTISNSAIINNYANEVGGGIYHNSATLPMTITNSVIYGNTSLNQNGAAISCKSSLATINNSTIAYNTCESDNRVEGFHYSGTGAVTFSNSILFHNLRANNDKDSGIDIGGTIPSTVISKNNIISYTNYTEFQNGSQGASGNLVNGAEVDADKMAFGGLMTNDAGLYFIPVYGSSIAKDAGDPETATVRDINGSLRSTPDIGAFEQGTNVNLDPYIETPAEIAYSDHWEEFQVVALDDESLTYAITGGANQSAMSITSGGSLSFINKPPIGQSFEVEVTVTDGIGGSSSRSFTIEVIERVYNVFMIVLDDLNDYIGVMGGHPQAKTPNIDKLAGEGVLFTNAYSNAPLCAPSRASFMSGILPTSSGYYGTGNFKSFPKVNDAKMISEYMMDNGYTTYKTGKITHSPSGENQWWDYYLEDSQDYGPVAYNGKGGVPHPNSSVELQIEGGSLDGTFGSLADIPNVPADFRDPANKPGYNGWYSTTRNQGFNYIDDDNRDAMPDEISVEWTKQQLQALADTDNRDPFMIATGLIRPHSPFVVPQKYFDMFPLETLELGNILIDDKDDTPITLDGRGIKIDRAVDNSFVDRNEGIRKYLQAYLASIAFADDMVGRLMDAIDDSPYKDNTVVMLFSDHGYAIGEKDQMWKYNLWKQNSRVPLIIRSPKFESSKGKKVTKPVSLVDIYPTIIDHCKLTGTTKKTDKAADLDGNSLLPLLADSENGLWTGNEEAFINTETWGYTDPNSHNYALTTERYRYISRIGGEEFYDELYDPNDWFNLIEEPAYNEVINKFRENLINHKNPSIALEDQMTDLNKMRNSSNIKLTTHMGGTINDFTQVSKISSNLAVLEYEVENIKSFSIDFWDTRDANNRLDVGKLKVYLASEDLVYSEIETDSTLSYKDWNTANTLMYTTPSEEVPSGTKYLKIEWETSETAQINKGFIGAVRIYNTDPILLHTGIDNIAVAVDDNWFNYNEDQVRNAAPDLPAFTDPLDDLTKAYSTSGCSYITGNGADNSDYLDDDGRVVRCATDGQFPQAASLTYEVAHLESFRVEFWGKAYKSVNDHDAEVGVIKTYVGDADDNLTEIKHRRIQLQYQGANELFAYVPDEKIPAGTKYFKFEIDGGTNAWSGQIGAVHLYGINSGDNLSTENIKDTSPYKISPIPANSSLQIHGIEKEMGFKIISMQGSLVKEGNTQGSIDIDTLKNGVYLLFLDTQTPIKFIKI